MGSGGMVEVGKNNTYSAGLNLNQTLWAGGQVKNTARLAKVTAEEGAYNLKHVRDLVTKAVVKYCYGIIYASAYIRVQEESLEVARQHLQETQAKYKQGLASSLDVLTQKVKVENIEPTVIQARKNFELSNLYLRQILNRDPEDKIYLTWSRQDLELPLPSYIWSAVPKTLHPNGIASKQCWQRCCLKTRTCYYLTSLPTTLTLIRFNGWRTSS